MSTCKQGHDTTAADSVYLRKHENGRTERTCKICAKERSKRQWELKTAGVKLHVLGDNYRRDQVGGATYVNSIPTIHQLQLSGVEAKYYVLNGRCDLIYLRDQTDGDRIVVSLADIKKLAAIVERTLRKEV